MIDRREFIFTTLAFTVLPLVKWGDFFGAAQARADDGSGRVQAFMRVSKLISPDINPVTGAALYQALKKADPDFDSKLSALESRAAATPAMTIELLAENLDRNGQKPLRDTLNSIVSAWYLGVVGFQTYAYRDALMFSSVKDVLSPPSYVRRGPLYWAASNGLPSD